MGGAPIVTLLGSQNLLNAIGSQNIRIIISALIFYISAVLLSEIISSFMEYYQNKFQTLINYKLNLQIMDKCTKLSLRHFEDAEVYDMLQRVQNETPYKPFEVFLSILGAISAIVTVFFIDDDPDPLETLGVDYINLHTTRFFLFISSRLAKESLMLVGCVHRKKGNHGICLT
ncbi:hypothetical protein DI43_19700 [Geobacillus sp. CAMR12739]|nr:hypothetical protein DI43_19700 [Geobacillus sp. CAMR12739]